MRFTLAQLEAFARIVDSGSFHGAARVLNLTQPTVSQRIRELEAALGKPVFVRNGPHIALTPEGHALTDYARRLLGTAGELAEHFRTGDPLQGVLRLGVTDTFALLCLTDLLRRLDQRHPSLKVSVRVHDSGTMSRLLEAHDLDVAILVEANISAHIRQVPVGHNALAWMASADMRLPRVTRPADLADLHLMLSPPPSRLHTTTMDWFSAAGVTPSRVSTCNSFTVTLETIRSGLAVGVVPVRLMQDDIARGRIRRLPVAPALPPHRVSICYQTAGLGPGLDAVVRLARELIDEHQLFQ